MREKKGKRKMGENTEIIQSSLDRNKKTKLS